MAFYRFHHSLSALSFAATVSLALSACVGGFSAPANTVCSATGMISVPYTSGSNWVYGKGYSSTTTSYYMSRVCTAYRCADGYYAHTGDASKGCYSGEEYARLRRPYLAAAMAKASKVAPQGELDSWRPVFSPDGNRVAFVTPSSNLAGATDAYANIVIKDLRTGELSRVTVGAGGAAPNGDSDWPQFMPDGQSLVFDSAASNLVEGDTNGQRDIFIKDLRSGVIRRLSLLAGGRQVNGSSRGPLLSADGRYMFFWSSSREWTRDAWGDSDCSYVKDLTTGSLLRVRTQNSDECVDQFVFARGSDTAWLLGYKSGERPLRKTWFSLDLRTGVYTQSRYDDPTTQSKWWVQPTVSRDGGKLAFIVAEPGGQQGYPRLVDLKTGAGDPVGLGLARLGWSDPQFSPSGDKLLFSTADTLLDARDRNKQWDVFTWDLRANVSTRVSVTQDGREGNGGSDSATFSPDGRRIVFLSSANNLVPGDTNDAVDVFVKDLRSGALSRVSIADRRSFAP